MIDLLGWVGGALLAFCGLPEAARTVWNKSCALSFSFLWMWLAGECLSMIYVAVKNEQVDLLPLLMNYGFNIIFVCVMLFYKKYPGGKNG